MRAPPPLFFLLVQCAVCMVASGANNCATIGRYTFCLMDGAPTAGVVGVNCSVEGASQSDVRPVCAETARWTEGPLGDQLCLALGFSSAKLACEDTSVSVTDGGACPLSCQGESGLQDCQHDTNCTGRSPVWLECNAPGYVACVGTPGQPAPNEEGDDYFYMRDGSLGSEITTGRCLARARLANSTYTGVGQTCWYTPKEGVPAAFSSRVNCSAPPCAVSVFKTDETYCNDPSPVRNGRVISVSSGAADTGFGVGTVIIVSCDEGYIMPGSALECVAQGQGQLLPAWNASINCSAIVTESTTVQPTENSTRDIAMVLGILNTTVISLAIIALFVVIIVCLRRGRKTVKDPPPPGSCTKAEDFNGTVTEGKPRYAPSDAAVPLNTLPEKPQRQSSTAAPEYAMVDKPAAARPLSHQADRASRSSAGGNSWDDPVRRSRASAQQPAERLTLPREHHQPAEQQRHSTRGQSRDDEEIFGEIIVSPRASILPQADLKSEPEEEEGVEQGWVENDIYGD